MKCARDMFFCDATWSFVEVSWVLLIGSPILDNSCTKEKKKAFMKTAVVCYTRFMSEEFDEKDELRLLEVFVIL